MSFALSTQQPNGYRINTAVYEGPLDLLLELIEKAELDITRLALAQVTDQFLEYLYHLEYRNPGEVSAFLVMASRLVLIKSIALLPRPVSVDTNQEEDPAEALARQLILYRRFKQLSQTLQDRQDREIHTFVRLSPPLYHVEAKLDLSDVTLDHLVEAARNIFSRPVLLDLSEVVNIPKITIREKITAIISRLRTRQMLTFDDLVTDNNRIDIVVTFLALLELIKRHLVRASQESNFSDVFLESETDANFDTEINGELDYAE